MGCVPNSNTSSKAAIKALKLVVRLVNTSKALEMNTAVQVYNHMKLRLIKNELKEKYTCQEKVCEKCNIQPHPKCKETLIRKYNIHTIALKNWIGGKKINLTPIPLIVIVAIYFRFPLPLFYVTALGCRGRWLIHKSTSLVFKILGMEVSIK